MKIFGFTKSRMKLKSILLVGLLMIVLVGVPLFFFVGRIPNERTRLQAVIVPYTYNGRIYLVRGDGSNAQKFSDNDGYVSVNINPWQTHLIAIKAFGGGTSEHLLVSIDLANKSEEILIEAQPLERLRCPQWSPDGTQIAFWRDDDYRPYERSDESGIFLWDVERKSMRQISGPITIFWDSCEDMGTYLRWVDNEHLAVYDGTGGSLGDTKGIWLIDIKETTLEKILDSPPYIKPYHSLTSKNFSEKVSVLPEEVIVALWGSLKNPRAAPYWDTAREFYFYHVLKEGFGAERWIEGYDPQVGRSFKVKTIWWKLYQE